jgi:2-polyprenyl-3-methyl-5-hydroxy-6-metoxy-1,4-benzoquinol methylase
MRRWLTDLLAKHLRLIKERVLRINLKTMFSSIDLEHFKAEGLDRLIPILFELLPPNMAQCVVLDVGCGPGIIASSVKRQFGAEVFGVDCDSIFLELAKAKGVTTYSCNIETDNFPFPDATFDCVLCIEVVEHLAKPENCLKEIARVIKPKGVLILSTPNLVGLSNRLAIISGKDPVSGHPFDRPYDRHIRLYALNSVTQLVSNWFKITRIVYINPYPRRTWKGIGRDLLCFLKKDLSTTMIITCQMKQENVHLKQVT